MINNTYININNTFYSSKPKKGKKKDKLFKLIIFLFGILLSTYAAYHYMPLQDWTIMTISLLLLQIEDIVK